MIEGVPGDALSARSVLLLPVDFLPHPVQTSLPRSNKLAPFKQRYPHLVFTLRLVAFTQQVWHVVLNGLIKFHILR